MRPRLSSPAAIAFVAAAILLVAIALATGLNLWNLQQSRELVARTNVILRETSALRAGLRQAETGQRGFLLTGDRAYLEPFRQAADQVPRTYARLESLILDPRQRTRLLALKPHIDLKLAELRQTVGLRHRSFEAALAVVRTNVGEREMALIETGLERFDVAEGQLLDGRVSAEQRAARLTSITAALTGALALLSTALGLLFLFRQRSIEAVQRMNLELEQLVHDRTSSLEEANQELDAFAYSISHDLRAPLRAMHGYADALEEDEQERLSQEGKGFLRHIKAAAARMDMIIADILSYASLSREELDLQPTNLDIVVGRVLRELERTGTDDKIDVAEPLGAVLAHPATLQQCLWNLLSNALKFVRPGERPLVTVHSERRDRCIRLWVEDRGIGIEPSHQDRIFRPFERLHGVEAYPGTGIGLAIVRRATQRMGGRSGVESRLGEGSRFWVELEHAEQEGS